MKTKSQISVIVGFHKLDSVKRDKVKFKSSGGIAVYVKNHIKDVISPIKNQYDHTDTLWFKIKKDYTSNRRGIFVGNVYFSPEVYEKKYNKDYLSLLEKEIAHFKAKGEVLVQGDFNGRTGNLQDLVEHSKFFEDENDITSVNTNSNFKYRRNSEECVVNSRGRDLIDLCHTSDLYIANGRVLGDCKGKNTCFQWNGCSLVDYLIVSNTIYNSLNYF